MFRINVSNNSVEKVMFLPNDIEIDVSKSWCHNVVSDLRASEYYGELLDKVSFLVSSHDYQTEQLLYPSRFVKMSVGDVKKIVNICQNETFCCIFPNNYDELANIFLKDKLGNIKMQIELLMADDKIDEVFELIDNIEDEYLRKLSLLYMKFIHCNQTEKLIEDIRSSRKRTINFINGKLY